MARKIVQAATVFAQQKKSPDDDDDQDLSFLQMSSKSRASAGMKRASKERTTGWLPGRFFQNGLIGPYSVLERDYAQKLIVVTIVWFYITNRIQKLRSND